MIQVKNLYKRFGQIEALKHVSFEVAPNETVGLLGENGAGKTTAMRILSCFIPPTTGTVRVAGRDVIFESAAVRRSIGYMPESVPLYPTMRVEEYLRFRARLKGVAGRDAGREVDRVLGLVNLRDRNRSLIQTLSKGLRQRVGLADALVHSPEILILDEPTSGLDPSQRREVRDLIRTLSEHHTLLISTHILPEVESSCDRVVVLGGGSIIAEASVDDLRKTGAGGRFKIRAKGEPESCRRVVEEMKGVEVHACATSEEGVVDLLLSSVEGGHDRTSVVAALVQSGLGVLDVSSAEDTLEDAVIRLLNREGDSS